MYKEGRGCNNNGKQAAKEKPRNMPCQIIVILLKSRMCGTVPPPPNISL